MFDSVCVPLEVQRFLDHGVCKIEMTTVPNLPKTKNVAEPGGVLPLFFLFVSREIEYVQKSFAAEQFCWQLHYVAL